MPYATNDGTRIMHVEASRRSDLVLPHVQAFLAENVVAHVSG
jgi:hypothetical protein